MDHLYQFCFFLIAQTQSAPAADAIKEAAAGAGEQPGGLFGMGYLFPAMLAVMVLYMFMSAKPQGQTANKTELIANLKKNDRVVTAGGILGTVVNVRSDAEFVTLRVDDSGGGRIQVLASSIVRVLSDEDTDKD